MQAPHTDSLRALGYALGTPEAPAQARALAASLRAQRGDAVASDMIAVAERADLAAAWRLSAALCPGAAFGLSEDASGVRVEYDGGGCRGTLTLSAEPGTPVPAAHALAVAAIALDTRLALDAALAPRRARGDSIRDVAVGLLDWSKTLHRPHSRAWQDINARARELAAGPDVTDGDEVPMHLVDAIGRIPRIGDLGEEADALAARLSGAQPAPH